MGVGGGGGVTVVVPAIRDRGYLQSARGADLWVRGWLKSPRNMFLACPQSVAASAKNCWSVRNAFGGCGHEGLLGSLNKVLGRGESRRILEVSRVSYTILQVYMRPIFGLHAAGS